MENDCLRYLEVLSELITAFTAVAAFIVSIPGLNSWKKQMTRRVEYELARRSLRAVYGVRDSIAIVRNPWVSYEEMVRSLKEKGEDKDPIDDSKATNHAVYSLRWDKIIKSQSDLQAEMGEAEIIWGHEIIEMTRQLDEKVRILWSSIDQFLKTGMFTDEIFRVMYHQGDRDEFSKEVDDAIKPLETFLRKHLELEPK